ncbi:MAG: TIGR02453 family protein [Nannocystaceae bacterium]
MKKKSGKKATKSEGPATAKRAPAVHRAAGPGFGPELLEFLGELSMNNDREWFAANRGRYERALREPALAFIRAMAAPLAAISPNFVASDKKVGGSLMRIHRDVRFSADKSPYKTNLGIQFRHSAGKDVHAPGFYFHVGGDGIFLAAGMWHPAADALAAIRAKIVDAPEAWLAARDDRGFRRAWSLGGESLSRPPRGFAKDHPQIEDIKRKDHIAACDLDVAEMFGPGAAARIAERFAQTSPYVRFLCGAVGEPF